MKEQPNEWGDVVYAYTRAQAIEDGVLVDVSKTAQEAGIKWPVALTSEVWALIEDIPEKHAHEDIQGRLWDVLWMARCAMAKSDRPSTETLYRLILHNNETDEVQLKIVAGPGDSGEPVITIMLPDQD